VIKPLITDASATSMLRHRCSDYPDPNDALPIQEGVWPSFSHLAAHLDDLVETARFLRRCAGLAANQVGSPFRMFVARVGGDDYREFVNPVLVGRCVAVKNEPEECMSVPGRKFRIRRSKNVILEWRSRQWNLHREEFSGREARIILHELDHLNGILVSDRGEEER
jgi:peptide deformylase